MYFLEEESKWMSVLMLSLGLVFFSFSVMFCLKDINWILEWELIMSGSCYMIFELYFDWMSIMFFSFVSLISGSVFWYSESYMKGDMSIRYFLILVFLFVASMFFMVFSLNLVSIMLGWDGLGITSYILVVYYKNEKSSAAGMITVLSNRVGDAMLILSIACMVELGSWNFMMSDILIDSIFLNLIGLAAITKSAQIPFSAWLPAAMAAPTPVSALVHSSTLVTAGVYMLIRFSDLLKASLAFELLTYLGMFTTLMASSSALFEADLKKVVALSTLSQLGIMVMTLSLGFIKLAFFHLLTHAIFKALLFMCSGKIIHMMGSSQDTRSMGGGVFNLPVTSVLMNFSNYALCGIPFLAGFYSKDFLIESSVMLDSFGFKYILLMMMVGLSASYSFRLSYFSLLIHKNSCGCMMSEEKDWTMLSSKSALLVLTAVSGALISWLMIKTPLMISLSLSLKLLTITSTMAGFSMGAWLSVKEEESLSLYKYMDKIEGLMTMWFLPGLSGMGFALNNFTTIKDFKRLDLGWAELYGGQGSNSVLVGHSQGLVLSQANSVKNFLAIFLIMLSLIFSFV